MSVALQRLFTGIVCVGAVSMMACHDAVVEPSTEPSALASDAARSAGYGVTDLGALGGVSSFANALNERGQVVGQAFASTDFLSYRAALWQNGGGTMLPGLGGGSSGNDINIRGQVAGYSWEPGFTKVHAVLWQRGAMIDLGNLGGTFNTWITATAVNQRGQVIGMSWNASDATRAFLWHNGEMTDLGTLEPESAAPNAAAAVASELITTDRLARVRFWQNGVIAAPGKLRWHGPAIDINQRLAGGRAGAPDRLGRGFQRQVGLAPEPCPIGGGAIANAINTRGQVVGFSWTSCHSPTAMHAVIWQGGGIKDLGTLGGWQSTATAINGVGQIVGESVTASGESHAFLWQNGTMLDLGTLGGASSTATAINLLGQVVGESQTASGEIHAFLWERGVMKDLGTLGGPSSTATDINLLSQIVGEAATTSGESHAFIWRNGAMTDLGTLGGASSTASAINLLGQVAGESVTGSGQSHAVLWTRR